jgi:hypothetical protein
MYVHFYEVNLSVNMICVYLHSNIVKRYGIPDQGGLMCRRVEVSPQVQFCVKIFVPRILRVGTNFPTCTYDHVKRY